MRRIRLSTPVFVPLVLNISDLKFTRDTGAQALSPTPFTNLFLSQVDMEDYQFRRKIDIHINLRLFGITDEE